jgi:hypothetical protein
MKDLKTHLYLTVHGSKKSVEQLADECGISASYLYRACLDGESGCRFPLDLAIPLMQASGDFQVLDHLNMRCGRITVNLARVARLKRKDPAAMNEIQRSFNAVMAQVLEFFETPDPTRIPEIEDALHKHLCEVAALKRTVADFHQQEMF